MKDRYKSVAKTMPPLALLQKVHTFVAHLNFKQMKQLFLKLHTIDGEKITVSINNIGMMRTVENGTEISLQGLKITVQEDVAEILSRYKALLLHPQKIDL
jgi:uncharacterized protein YlzI (FlbEa/FlbD family)